ncbi:uncharacterized protein METZ01_LOCUS308314, partial [marine metagenome]
MAANLIASLKLPILSINPNSLAFGA